ncbi:MAG: hypothetical protein WD873_07805, partial [Candidatus Hydrogenedentales bacterium]
MSGIVSYGAYVPFNRLQRSVIGQALEARGGKGERAVAGFDEDTATLAVEAARNCLRNADKSSVRGLFFATTNPPYQEKLNAATVHAALELPEQTRALDLGGSARSGLAGMLLAKDAAPALGPTLVTAADIRLGAPEGAIEQSAGDGAAAFLLGNDNVIAEFEATYSETLEHEGMWRGPGEKFPKTWEERFTLTQVYVPLLQKAGQAIAKQAGVKPGDLAKVIIVAPNARAVDAVVKTLGLKPDQ